MLRAYKYRLYPNASQAELIAKHFGCVRYIYNWAIAKRIKHYESTKKILSRFELCAEIPKLKADKETAWLSEVNSQSLQSTLRNLDEAYTRFFREKKGFPRFKSKHDNRQSFQCPQLVSVDFESHLINIPKIKNIKARISRTFDGKIKTVTISRVPSGKHYASIMVDDRKPEPKPDGNIKEYGVMGIDLGLKHFATLSTGEKIANPKPLKWALKKLARAQRSLARKKKGSKNRNKCKRKLAIIHECVTNRRRDFQHKLSTRLIRENQAVAIESLNVSGMQKNSRLARMIGDAAWAQFVDMLKYKAKWNGKTVLQIGQFEPSSKLCICGQLNHDLKLSDRKWTCVHCGETHDRDILAANNIKRMALHPKNFLAQGMREFTPVETGNSRSVKQELVAEKQLNSKLWEC